MTHRESDTIKKHPRPSGAGAVQASAGDARAAACPTAALVLIDLETDGGITGRCLRVRLRAVDAQADRRLRGGDGGDDQGRRAGAVRDRGQAAQAADAARHARPGGHRAGRDRHGAWDALRPGRTACRWSSCSAVRSGRCAPTTAAACGFSRWKSVADEAEQLVAEGGFTAVKLRIGRDDPAQDLAAVRAVKKRVGDRDQRDVGLQPAAHA